MPANDDDIRALKDLLRWARTSRADARVRSDLLADALERAIGYLEAPDSRKAIMLWILGAIRESVREPRTPGGMWVVTNQSLYGWALDQMQHVLEQS